MENSKPVYRVDKFIVPAKSRTEFLERVRATHAVLAKQPGFVRDLVLEQVAGPGEFNLVTLAEWESEAMIAEAAQAVQALHRELGFDPQAAMVRMGVRPDLAYYQSV
jgi:hypothetical protein